MEEWPKMPRQENPENLQKPEELNQIPDYISPTENPEDIIVREERERADATRLAEIRTSLGISPADKQSELVPEEVVEKHVEISKTETKIENQKEENIEIDQNLKTRG